MDRTETYIKMSEKADKIQALRPDGLLDGDYGKYGLAYYLGRGMFNVAGYPESTWLPRQDELCRLTKLSWREFDIECLKYDVDTKEKAGIQVVMSQFNKKWVNGDWVE